MKDDFAWGRHCESQNKDEIFYGALFGIRLVTLCRVLILMLIFKIL